MICPKCVQPKIVYPCTAATSSSPLTFARKLFVYRPATLLLRGEVVGARTTFRRVYFLFVRFFFFFCFLDVHSHPSTHSEFVSSLFLVGEEGCTFTSLSLGGGGTHLFPLTPSLCGSLSCVYA